MYVTDTHSFLWFLTKDERLGSKAKEIFRLCDQGREIIIIPAIVLLECLYICERKKIDLKFKEILLKMKNTFNYITYPLDEKIVLECQNLKQFSDLHNRIVVTTAKLLNAKLITKDEKIKKSKLVKTVWYFSIFISSFAS